MSTFFIIVCDAYKYYTKEGDGNLKSFCINTCDVFVMFICTGILW